MRLSTFARVAWDWGARSEVAETLQRLLQMQGAQPSFRFDEPFWPPHPRFDTVPHGGSPRGWFALASAEQFELAHVFSSYFMSRSPVLEWLCQQPLAAAQMQRRYVLRAARAGVKPIVPPRLMQGAADHLNAELWRKGKVPGTQAKPAR
jgi:hypothetical protein